MKNKSLVHLQAIYLTTKSEIYLTWLQKIPPSSCTYEKDLYDSYYYSECSQNVTNGKPKCNDKEIVRNESFVIIFKFLMMWLDSSISRWFTL